MNTFVKASEIGEYVYCQRAWWLRFKDLLPTTSAMEAGTAGHNALSQRIQQFRKLMRLALIILGLGILLLIIALSIYFLFT